MEIFVVDLKSVQLFLDQGDIIPSRRVPAFKIVIHVSHKPFVSDEFKKEKEKELCPDLSSISEAFYFKIRP